MTKDRPQTEGATPPALSDRLSVRVPVAVELTGISRTKLYELIKTGQVPIVKVGAATVIPVDSLREFITSNKR